MVVPRLGNLEDVELREAWNHEAHSFTPWLAENLDTLANEIGVPLEFVGSEVPVDSFSADILARNLADDSLVLIENQLEETDHKHLGQIMTYLAGLDAHTVVWVAKDFREAHLSAVHWLNNHTAEPFSFFAVKIRVVRIGNSSLAPIFDVVARPNHWERRLQAISKEQQAMSALGEFRLGFWTHYLEQFPQEESHGVANAAISRWRVVTGLSDEAVNSIDLVVSIYIGKSQSGIFIRGQRRVAGLDVHALLLPHKEEWQAILERQLEGPDNKHFLVTSYDCDLSDRSQWPDLAVWLYQMSEKYEAALRHVLG